MKMEQIIIFVSCFLLGWFMGDSYTLRKELKEKKAELIAIKTQASNLGFAVYNPTNNPDLIWKNK